MVGWRGLMDNWDSMHIPCIHLVVLIVKLKTRRLEILSFKEKLIY